MGLILDRDQLCAALGVSDSAVTAWEKKGMPTVRRGRGRGMRSLYDLDQVRAWLAKTGYGHSLQALAARFSRIEPPPAPLAAVQAVHTSAPITEEQAECLAWYPGLESALLALPGILQRAALAEAQIDAVLDGVLQAIAGELQARGESAEVCDRLRKMLAEERLAPGSWT